MYIEENTKVHQLMAKRVTVAKPDNKFSEALELFQTYKLRHLPIVDDNDVLLGIVSSNDLSKKFAEVAMQKDVFTNADLNKNLKLEDIMTRNVVTMHPDDLIKDMTKILDENNISSVLVTDDDNKVVGIVTDKDLV
ncbi:MAG: CBS domain-containing protein, partial [Chitinophagales bacterium]